MAEESTTPAWLEPALEATHDDQLRADLLAAADDWQDAQPPMETVGACVTAMLDAEEADGDAARHVRAQTRAHLRRAVALLAALADSEPLDVGCDEFLLIGVLDEIVAGIVQPAIPDFARF